MAKKELQLHEDLRRENHVATSSDRSFGITFAVVCGLVAAYGWWKSGHVPVYWLGASAAFAAVALVYARLLAPLNRLWTKLGLLMFKVVNPVVMTVLYTTTIVPVGLLMKLAGRDPLNRRFDKEARSYWILREPPGPAPQSMKNQF